MQHGILAISTPMFLVALAVLARHSVDPSHTAAVVAGLAAIVAVQWAWLRRMRGRAQRPAKGGRWRWWAEITGAFTLVAFTAAAVGLSLATIQEREANARGDRQDAVAFHLQQIGQQQALRDLEGLSLIASLDAEEVTARQLSAISAGAGVSGEDLFLAEEYANEAEAIAAMTDEIDDRIRGTDQDLRDQLRSGVAAAESQECDIASADPARTSRELFTELELEPDVVMAHVLSHQGPALSCDIVAALSRSEARGWSDRASTLTVTLVVLGLAGFLLALAASSERSARSSRTLFVLGAAGTASALIIGLVPATALLTGPREPRGDSARDFGRDVGNVVSDPCGGDEGLDAAIATYGSFGPAFQARAYATNCGSAIHEWPAVSSHVDPARVPEIVSDLEQALIHGPDTPQLRGDLGWFLILSGIHEREPRDIQGGLASTTRAINQLEDDASGAGGAIHILRFNRALALAALDDPSSALEAYRTAVRCLRPDEQCQGGGLVDRNLEESIRFGALGDLELVGGGMDLDDYRFEIVGSTRGDASTPPVGEGGIDVFPQELQVSVAVNDGADSQASIVWYYRPDDRASWAVLPGPSASTWRVGPHLNTPVPTRTLLPSGQYRADVYSAGRRVELLTEHEADSDMVRHASRRLGLSVVVPSQWTEWRDDGVEWHIGPTAKSGVTLRRTEAAAPAEIVPYLITQLLNWPATRADPELTPADDDWFLGLDDTVVGRTAEDGRVMAAAGLAPYASHWGCGGTLFLARVTSDPASPPPERIYESIVLERQADALPQNPGTLEAEGVRVQVPWYWDAAPRPEGSTNSLMSAKDCTGDANLIVSSRPIAQPLSDYVADLVETYRLGFPEFKLESQSQEPVDGANDAMRLRLTWQPQHLDEPIRQWVVFAVKDDHVIRATVSTNVRDSDYYREDIDLMMSSFALVG